MRTGERYDHCERRVEVRMSRALSFGFLLSLLPFVPGVARADEIAAASPSLDVTTATALGAAGSTRWSRVTVSGPGKVLWLVPVRPGGEVAWASDGWLDALDDTTAPRILPPATVCAAGSWVTVTTRPERIGSFARSGAKQAPGTFSITTSASELAPFAPRSDVAARAAALYASGWSLAAVELSTGSGLSTSATLRVTDGDMAQALPLVVTQGGTDARMTSFVLAGAPVTTGNELDPTMLTWSSVQSDYVDQRARLLGGPGTWLRESSSHAGVVEPLAVPNGATVAPLVTTAPAELAAAGLEPASLTITRFAGRLPTMAVATPLAGGGERPQVQNAGVLVDCVATPETTPVPAPHPGHAHGGSTVVVEDDYYYSDESCGTTAYPDVSDDTGGGAVVGGTVIPDDDYVDDEDGSYDDSGDDDDDDDWWDSGDDDSDDDDDDDWWRGDDDSDDTDTQTVRTKARKTASHRSRSPVSRFALLLVALVLPFRRRLRRVTL